MTNTRRIGIGWGIGILCVAGCAQSLDDWCYHEEQVPDGTAPCEAPEISFESGVPADTFRCGSYVQQRNGGGFETETRYFKRTDGTFVAVEYTSDVNAEKVWYGKKLSCNPTCTYDETWLETGATLCDTTPDW